MEEAREGVVIVEEVQFIGDRQDAILSMRRPYKCNIHINTSAG